MRGPHAQKKKKKKKKKKQALVYQVFFWSFWINLDVLQFVFVATGFSNERWLKQNAVA